MVLYTVFLISARLHLHKTLQKMLKTQEQLEKQW